jgi:ABC-type uncharacterized transport system fused permease/ATPase subunit
VCVCVCLRPAVAFLDEATGALDNDTEAALYQALRSHCNCFVSIGGSLRCLDSMNAG